jgi:hypothetical protein
LLTAVGFAVLFNGALVCTFAWPHWLPAWVTFTVWSVTSAVWVGSTWYELRSFPRIHSRSDAAGDALFAKAQQEYLNRNWFEAESLLQQVLKDNRDDVDAHLMLATLYRHTERVEEADDCLCRLERMERAGKWSLEIARERNLLVELGSKPETDQDGCPSSQTETNR